MIGPVVSAGYTRCNKLPTHSRSVIWPRRDTLRNSSRLTPPLIDEGAMVNHVRSASPSTHTGVSAVPTLGTSETAMTPPPPRIGRSNWSTSDPGLRRELCAHGRTEVFHTALSGR
jgi:hypothetical protein